MPLIGVLVIGLIASISAFLIVWSWETRWAKANFVDLAYDHARALQSGIDQYLGKVSSVRALFDASYEVDQGEFEIFTGRILQPRQRVVRLSWAPRVPHSRRVEHVAEARADGLSNYEIRVAAAYGGYEPAPEKSTYFPRRYATGLEKSSPLFGLDLSSKPDWRAAMDRARDGDKMATASDLRVGGRPGFLVTLPVYENDTPVQTVAQRREALEGFVNGVFVILAMVDAILASAAVSGNVSLYLYGPAARAETLPLYSRQIALAQRSRRAIAACADRIRTALGRDLVVGDARWTLMATPSGNAIVDCYRSWLALLAGLLVTSAAAAFVWMSLRYTRRLERVNRRVTQLA